MRYRTKRQVKLVMAVLSLPFFIAGLVLIVAGVILSYPIVKVLGLRHILNWRGR